MSDFFRIGVEFARATDLAARNVIVWSGKARKNEADQVAVESMRQCIAELPYASHVLIGEGEKDQAPMLYAGERFGSPGQTELDLVVDPLECTTNFAHGLHDSLSVLLAVPPGTIPAIPGTYMTQMLLPDSPAASFFRQQEVGPLLDTNIKEILRTVARENGVDVGSLNVVIQDRPRHKEIIEGARSAGAGVALIDSGSVSAAAEILMRKGGRWSLLFGTYGAPEGLILAFMAKMTGGFFAGRIAPHDPLFEHQTRILGLEDRALSAEEWVKGDGCLIMTCIHSSTYLRGVEVRAGHTFTESLLWTRSGVHRLSHKNGELCESTKLMSL
ncbi:MAG: fructose-bisphosphatase class II [Leptospirales bacterium]|nr:fructose-bisphosphatase class II [Leptospirales bacterium]